MRFGRLALLILATTVVLALPSAASAACPETGCPGGGGGTTTYDVTITVHGSGTVKVGLANLCSQSGANSATQTCTVSYEENTLHTFTATAGTGFGFSGWSGDCTGTGNCSVTMTDN